MFHLNIYYIYKYIKTQQITNIHEQSPPVINDHFNVIRPVLIKSILVYVSSNGV